MTDERPQQPCRRVTEQDLAGPVGALLAERLHAAAPLCYGAANWRARMTQALRDNGGFVGVCGRPGDPAQPGFALVRGRLENEEMSARPVVRCIWLWGSPGANDPLLLDAFRGLRAWAAGHGAWLVHPDAAMSDLKPSVLRAYFKGVEVRETWHDAKVV